MKTVLFISHGSKSPQAFDEVEALVQSLRESFQNTFIQSCYLEINEPSIPSGIVACIKEGASEIIVILNFLNTGRHVQEHIPAILKEAEAKHPEVSFKITPCIGQNEAMRSVYEQIIQSAC